MAELGENSKFVYMTEQELKDIITEAAAEGARIAIADRDRKNEAEVKRQNDQRLYNLQKLLQNYRHIRANFLETISNGAQAREQTQEEAIRRLMEGKDDVDVAALETTKTRSGIIIADVDKMMKVFRKECDLKGEMGKRMYDVIRSMYFLKKPKSVKELAEKWDVSKVTINNDKNRAIEILSTNTFGMAAVKNYHQNNGKR